MGFNSGFKGLTCHWTYLLIRNFLFYHISKKHSLMHRHGRHEVHEMSLWSAMLWRVSLSASYNFRISPCCLHFYRLLSDVESDGVNFFVVKFINNCPWYIFRALISSSSRRFGVQLVLRPETQEGNLFTWHKSVTNNTIMYATLHKDKWEPFVFGDKNDDAINKRRTGWGWK